LDPVLVLGIDEFLVFLACFGQGGEFVDHDVFLFKFGLQLRDFLLVLQDYFMQVVKLCFDGQVCVFVFGFAQFLDESVDLCDLFLVLCAFE
jgi:hypothetical protein